MKILVVDDEKLLVKGVNNPCQLRCIKRSRN